MQNVSESITKAFLAMDEDLIKKYRKFPKNRELNNVGSTALVLLFVDNEVYVCSLGTSLGIICLKNGSSVYYLNHINSLQNVEERNRMNSIVGCYKSSYN